MSSPNARELAHRFRDQYGVISRPQLYALGITDGSLRRRLSTGEWERLGPKVVRLAGSSPTPEQELLALCLAAGPASVASHASAAWLWRLAEAPDRHAVTVPRSLSARTRGGDVHRPVDFPAHVVVHRRIPCTDPLRTIVDVAAVSPPAELENVIDRALASRVLTIEAMEAELARVAQRGRCGTEALRFALKWRKCAGVSQPSVLESRALRLLQRVGLKPVAVEVRTSADLACRVDILLRPGLAMEVDGYAYHHSPEQMAEDARRRNRLFLSGTQVLVYTWRDIVYDGHRVISEVRHAVHRTGG